jgi:hypothetical protein
LTGFIPGNSQSRRQRIRKLACDAKTDADLCRPATRFTKQERYLGLIRQEILQFRLHEFVDHGGGNTPGIGGRLPTYRFITRKSAMMAAWFLVIE